MAVMSDDDAELADKFVGDALRAQVADLKALLAAETARLDAERAHNRYPLLAVGQLRRAEIPARENYRPLTGDVSQTEFDAVFNRRQVLLNKVDDLLEPLAPPAK